MMPENNSMHQIETAAKEWLEKRGVKISEIADLVYVLQKKYHPNLTKEECEENVNRVMKKREVQNAVITGIQLDMLGEQRKLMEPLQTLIETDESLYGVDEILSFSIVNLYGSIGYTNYGGAYHVNLCGFLAIGRKCKVFAVRRPAGMLVSAFPKRPLHRSLFFAVVDHDMRII